TFGIDEPNRRNAELEVIVDLVLNVSRAVLGRKNLDDYLRWGRDDASCRPSAPDNDNVRHAESLGADLDPDLDTSPKGARVHQDERVGPALRIAVTDFPHMALH